MQYPTALAMALYPPHTNLDIIKSFPIKNNTICVCVETTKPSVVYSYIHHNNNIQFINRKVNHFTILLVYYIALYIQ